jgi:hypothetical protein
VGVRSCGDEPDGGETGAVFTAVLGRTGGPMPPSGDQVRVRSA